MQLLQARPENIVETLEQDQTRLLTWMEAIQVITSEAEQKNAEDLLIHARQALKNVEAKRKELQEPITEARDRINDLFKPLADKLRLSISLVNGALQARHAEQARIAEEERMALLAEQAAKLAEAQDTGEVVELPSASVMPEAPTKTSRAHLGTVTYHEDIDVIVVNPLLVPRELCDPNIPRIRARAKSGVKEIPGVLITKKYTTYTRGGA